MICGGWPHTPRPLQGFLNEWNKAVHWQKQQILALLNQLLLEVPRKPGVAVPWDLLAQ